MTTTPLARPRAPSISSRPRRRRVPEFDARCAIRTRRQPSVQRRRRIVRPSRSTRPASAIRTSQVPAMAPSSWNVDMNPEAAEDTGIDQHGMRTVAFENHRKRRGDTMMKRTKSMNRFALMAVCCSLGALLPTESFAGLQNIACKAIRRGCNADCAANGGSQSCYSGCRSDYQNCAFGSGTTTKQQTPPPPCTGPTCNLRNPHPPTTVSAPPPPPSPTKPVDPVNVSNPNKTTTGNSPVILERGSGSGGHGHH
jgi:hypothetical protein